MDPSRRTPGEGAGQPHVNVGDPASPERPIDVGTWTWDTRTGEVVWSSELDDFYGAAPTRSSLTTSWYTGLVHPDDAASVAEALERVVAAGGDASVAYRARRRDGDLRHLVVRAQRDGTTGDRVTGVVIDLTDRHRAEVAFAETAERETEAARVLQELNDQKDVFIRTVSHDLRSPLLVIERFASLLRAGAADLPESERREYAQRIVEMSKRLQRQLGDLLDLDRLSRGAVEPIRQPVDVLELARGSVQALDLGQRVVVEGEPLVADLDPGLVERIIENLLTNAARHGGESGRIVVHVARHGGGVLLTVDDEGPGVPEELRGAVFDVFRTGEMSSAGTGVGLSVVRRFAELHGGTVWIEEAPGGGASVNVMLAAGVR